MNESIAKRTQDSLGKIIGKKPPLTEKLLNRPPFRFLHDIITSVIRQTGFMKGLFTEKESSAESITTKEEKVAFLQKAIDITVYATGTKLSVRPSKVVAGLEAEKTNDFLQALAAAIEKKPDNEACVKKILGGGSGEPSSRSRDSNAKEAGDSKDKDRERSADRRKRRSDRNEDKENRQGSDRREGSGRNREREERKDKEKDRDERKERDREERKEKDRDERKEKEREDRKHRDSSKDGRRESSRHRESSRDRKETDRRDDRRERSSKGHRKREEEQVNGHTDETNAESAPAADDAEGEDEPTANRIPRPSSAKGSRRRHREGRRPQPDMEDDDNAQSERKSMQQSGGQEEDSVVPPQVEQTRRLARPSSARPAPPRVKRQDGVQDSLTERVDSARTQRVQNVIIDNAQHSEEEDDNFMVEEGAQDPLVPEREETIAPPTEDDGQHGGLVKKILESKKEYAQSEQPQQSQTKTKIDKSSMNDAARHKEKEMVKKEVDKLRGSIQTLTRSANPLGKIMDYVQEDLHSMQKERDMWKAENRKLTEQIKQELSVTDGSIEPLKVTLAQLEQAVADQLDLIAAVKHSIIDNDEKITKMISSVSRT